MKARDLQREAEKNEIVLDSLAPPSRPTIAIGNVLTFLIVMAVICVFSFVKVPYETEVEMDSFHFSSDSLLMTSSKYNVAPIKGQKVNLRFSNFNTIITYSGVIADITKKEKNTSLLVKMNNFKSRDLSATMKIIVSSKNKLTIFQCFQLGNN